MTSEQPNDMMIVDEIDSAPINSQDPNKLGTKDDTPGSQGSTEVDLKSHAKGGKKGNGSPQKEGRKKSKAERSALLSSPIRILQDVLSKSQFKIPNLSQLVEEKFNAPDFRLDLANELRDITYQDTTLHVPYIDKSVLPTEIEITHTVSVSPSAITLLQCIHEQPKKRERYRKGKKKNGGGGVSNEMNGHNGHNQHHQHQQRQQNQQNRQSRHYRESPRRNGWVRRNNPRHSSNKDD